MADGFRKSEQSWRHLLLDCRQRGLVVDPKPAVADGALGFWKARPQVFPSTRVACLTMVFKLLESASKTWRALNGSTLVADVFAGVQFADGVKKAAA